MTPDKTAWYLPADDIPGEPTIVRLTAQMGLPHMELHISGGDGFTSPARARRLALQLLEAANAAEERVFVDEREVS